MSASAAAPLKGESVARHSASTAVRSSPFDAVKRPLQLFGPNSAVHIQSMSTARPSISAAAICHGAGSPSRA